MGIAARWHETFEEWLKRNEASLDSLMVHSLRRKMLDRLLHRTFKAYYKRNWTEYHLLRNYLRRYSGDSAVQRLLDGRIPPRWLHALRQGLSKLRAA